MIAQVGRVAPTSNELVVAQQANHVAYHASSLAAGVGYAYSSHRLLHWSVFPSHTSALSKHSISHVVLLFEFFAIKL